MATGTSEAPRTGPPRSGAGRWVRWVGLMAGTALTVLALTDGVRLHVSHAIPSWLSGLLGFLVLWATLIVTATIVTELTRRHGRTAAATAGRGGARAAVAGGRLAGRHARRGGGWATRAAGTRWDARTGAGERLFADPSVTDRLTELRDRRRRLYRRHASNPLEDTVDDIPVIGAATIDPAAGAGDVMPPLPADGEAASPDPGPRPTRRVDGKPETPADTRFFDLRQSGYTGWIDSDGYAVDTPDTSSTEGTPMPESDTIAPAGGFTRPRGARRPAGDAGGAWKSLVSGTGDFEPEDDAHLLTWMAGETTGMSLYAEAITDVYETVVNTIGVDPVAMAALHDYADAAAEAAHAMALARQRFAAHYAEVREFASRGGVLPYNGRWVTGEGDG